MEEREQTYIGLGANVGAAREALVDAVAALAALPGAHISGVSRLYRTRPVGPVAQAEFLNAVVGLVVPAAPDPATAAMALLIDLKRLERAAGRIERERWGPREVDLDLLLFGAHRIHLERASAARSADTTQPGPQWLDVPHPAAAERLFVLAPLSDLAPALQPPGWTGPVADQRDAAERAEGADAVRVVGRWDAAASAWTDDEISAGSGVDR